MKYISNSENINLIKETADDKLIEILSSLLQSKIYFYDRESTAKNIASVSSQIDSLNELIQSLPSKTNDELFAIASTYGITLADGLTSDFVIGEIQGAIYSKIDELTKESISLSSDFNNYKRTYIYTMESHVQSLEDAYNKTYDINLKAKYEFLHGKFKSLIEKLQVLSNWVLALAPEMDKLEDIVDTIKCTKFELSDMYKKSADINSSNLPQDQVDTLDKSSEDLEYEIKQLEDEYAGCKAKVLEIFEENHVQINFKDLKEEIFEDLIYIKTNMKEASENGALSIKETDIDKYMDAFYSMFYYPIINECEFRTYLAENGVTFEENSKTFGEIANTDQKVSEPVQEVAQPILTNAEVNAAEQEVPEQPVSEQVEAASENSEQPSSEYENDGFPRIDSFAIVEPQVDTVWEHTADEKTKEDKSVQESESVPTENVPEGTTPETSVPAEPVVPEEPIQENASTGQTVFGVVSTTPTSEGDLANAKVKAKGIINDKESSGVRVRGGNL